MPGTANHYRKTLKRSPPKTHHAAVNVGASGGIAADVKKRAQLKAWKKERNAIQKEEMKKGGMRHRTRKNRH
jgi:hypothetical protein